MRSLKNRVLSAEEQNQQSRPLVVTGRYYLISTKWTGRTDAFITFWRGNNSGYCYYKGWAGIYTELDADFHKNDIDVLPVSVDVVDALWRNQFYDGEVERFCLTILKI